MEEIGKFLQRAKTSLQPGKFKFSAKELNGKILNQAFGV